MNVSFNQSDAYLSLAEDEHDRTKYLHHKIIKTTMDANANNANANANDINLTCSKYDTKTTECSNSNNTPSSNCNNATAIATTTTTSATTPSKKNRYNKSLIESASPQIPIYFSKKGNFSQRRRILKGRKIVSVEEYNHSQIVPFDYKYGNMNSRTNKAVRRVQMVSKRAALASKRKIWDSNDASIDAAQSAVDKWEASYQTFRSFLINTTKSAKQIYNTSKSASQKIENGLLLPIRDIILLPAFNTFEHAADITVGFLKSEQAHNVALSSLDIVKRTPFIGENILAPALITSFDIIKQSWNVIQYPIPSKENVRWTVDTIMTGTKWFLLTSSREIYFYAKLVDATVTRTLSHTQWRVLGSGPYSTLNDEHKQEVINHLCERYFSLKDDMIARYELAAHIKFHNRGLYYDLVQSGLLLERWRKVRGGDGGCGGDMNITIDDDTWLKPSPAYRVENMEDNDVLLIRGKGNTYNFTESFDNETKSLQYEQQHQKIKPLWFYQPSQNGKKVKDTPWVCFNSSDQSIIENGFISYLENLQIPSSVSAHPLEQQHTSHTRVTSPVNEEKKEPISTSEGGHVFASSQDTVDESSLPFQLSHWYEPRINDDILIEEKRHAISFLPHCPSCKSIHSVPTQTSLAQFPQSESSYYGSLCRMCWQDPVNKTTDFPLLFPVTTLMRPTLWRFHGEGNDVRRGVWLMDTKRGLQPYSDESAAVLEDAYLFLKWTKTSQENSSIKVGKSGIDAVLLTVQVIGPDGDESQLVQFRSLTQITAIQKTIAGGFSLFKRRVYRGAQSNIEESLQGDNKELGKSVSRSSHELLSAPVSVQNHHEDVKTTNNAVDDTASHLILVVHGIGEMLRSSDFFGMSLPPMTSSIVDCCSSLRKNHADVLAANNNSSDNSSMGRVEYLPIEWHEAFAMKSRWAPDGNFNDCVTLEDISLTTIPHMREFANDTMLDILFFMSPKHHDTMIDIVCKEMNTVVQKYRSLTGFNGKVSLLAHSLGSVITWDILSFQNSLNSVYDEETNVEDSTTSSCIPKLDFNIANTFMIGSPVAVFLMLRNQHEPLSECFFLPGCRNVFNIFHPYDPVAYRIEPLLSSHNAEVEPKIITHWKGGFRVQYQTKFLWRQIVDNTFRTQKTMVRAVEAGIEGIGLLDKTVDDLILDEEDDDTSIFSDDSSFQRIRVGNLCGGKRLDYMLQEKEIENANEYFAALAAHSSYWGERDLSLFMARQIFHSEQESQQGRYEDLGNEIKSDSEPCKEVNQSDV